MHLPEAWVEVVEVVAVVVFGVAVSVVVAFEAAVLVEAGIVAADSAAADFVVVTGEDTRGIAAAVSPGPRP